MADSLAAARLELQARLPRITKDQSGQPGTRPYTYAGLPGIHDAILPLLCELGLLWITKPCLAGDGTFVLRYSLVHAATGEGDTGDYPLPDPASGPQVLGSAITYARRYALTAILGLAPDDDDGAAAQADVGLRGGRMSIGQKAAHERLTAQATSGPKPADRSRGRLPDDEWTLPPAELRPGSATPEQLRDLGIAYTALGVASREARLTDMRDRTGRELEFSKDLSYAEAQNAIKALKELKEERG